ncbi:MAG: bacteriohemerythrin [Gammaproteobacteria bacterium]|nr:bacteriohemerythrin [Gammaproteobacteria bacterium]
MSTEHQGAPLGVRWGDHMSVGVPELDADHERIIHKLNELVTAHDRHLDREAIDGLYADLLAIVGAHFAREERAMAECGYEGLAYHAGEHRRIRARLLEIQEHELHAEEAEVRAEVREFLTNWLYGHVLVDDFAYRGVFNQHPEKVDEALAAVGDG